MPAVMSPLKERITEDMKNALRSGQKTSLGTIRLILAAIKQVEVDTRKDLDDTRILAILDKMSKQRRESITLFTQANRLELAEKEDQELTLIQGYLPEQLSDAEISVLIDAAIGATGAETMRDMGKVMGRLKPQLQGKADMSAVSAVIKSRLTG